MRDEEMVKDFEKEAAIGFENLKRLNNKIMEFAILKGIGTNMATSYKHFGDSIEDLMCTFADLESRLNDELSKN